MAGLLNLFRGRSKSRPGKKDLSKGKQPAMPPPSAPDVQTEASSPPPPDPASAPLPLMRSDSRFVKAKQQPAPDSEVAIGGASYETMEPGDAPMTGTYPLHGNARTSIPQDATSLYRYDSLKNGEAPLQGTMPLHGNASVRTPSQTRSISSNNNAMDRSTSATSTTRRQSGVRAPSSHRRSVPPGTSVSVDGDQPLTRRFSFNGSPNAPPISTEQAVPPQNVYTDTSEKLVPATNGQADAATARTVTPQTSNSATAPAQSSASSTILAQAIPQRTNSIPAAQTNAKATKQEQIKKQLENVPAVPVIPNKYQGGSADRNGKAVHSRQPSQASQAVGSTRQRMTSVSSKTSTASRTPIADEFASTTWYSREDSPPPPSWSQLNEGQVSANHSRKQSTEQESTAAAEATLRSSKLPPRQLDNAPNKSAPPPPVDEQETANGTKSTIWPFPEPAPPPSRGRKPKRSVDRVPLELRDAPWNQPGFEPASYSAQVAESSADANQVNPHLQQDVSSSTQLDSRAITNGEGYIPGVSQSTEAAVSGRTIKFSEKPTPHKAAHGKSTSGSGNGFSKSFESQGDPGQQSLEGIVDLSNTVDTTIEETIAPAVVHEIVKPKTHNITEERITREFHNHSYHHRILPIVDVQVLPAKHFVPTAPGSNEFVEVPPDSIPGRAVDGRKNYNWVIAETVSRSKEPATISEQQAIGPRRFTARTFEGTEGDYREWVDENGVKRSESTWVYPPEIAQAPIESGLTVPLIMDDTTKPAAS